MNTAIFLLNFLQLVGAYKKYSVHNDELTWDDARKSCENNGGFLLTTQSAEVFNNLPKELSSTSLYREEFWIGMRTSYSDCSRYTWHSGGNVEIWRNWATDEPNFCSDDRCIRMQFQKWKTTNCYTTYKYICENNIDEENEITTRVSDEKENEIVSDDKENENPTSASDDEENENEITRTVSNGKENEITTIVSDDKENEITTIVSDDKENEITTIVSDNKENETTTISDDKQNEIKPVVSDDKENEMTTIISDDKENEVTPISDDKENEVTPISDDKENEVTQISDDKENEITPIVPDDKENEVTTIVPDDAIATTDQLQTTDKEGSYSLDLEVNVSASVFPMVSNESHSLTALQTSEGIESSTNASDEAISVTPLAADGNFADYRRDFSSVMDLTILATAINGVSITLNGSEGLVNNRQMNDYLSPTGILTTYDDTVKIDDTGLISVMRQMPSVTTIGDGLIGDVTSLDSLNLLATVKTSVIPIDGVGDGDVSKIATASTSQNDFSSIHSPHSCCSGKTKDLMCDSIVWDGHGINKALKAEIKRLQEELRVARNSTKIYIRSKKSIYDESTRSVTLGILGILVIVFVVCLILISDLVNFVVVIGNLRQRNSVHATDAA